MSEDYAITIKVKLGTILNKYRWERFCDIKGYDYWCMNEGLADSDDSVELTLEEAREIGMNV